MCRCIAPDGWTNEDSRRRFSRRFSLGGPRAELARCAGLYWYIINQYKRKQAAVFVTR